MLAFLVVLLLSPSSEVERVANHLARVELELLASDVRELTAAQLAQRAMVLDELHSYRERRVFPHNHDHVLPMPYFIDEHGVRCAMAHLIETFGGAALVHRVARTNNNVFVYELTKDVELRAWLDAHGLTLEDAARIQPSYVRFPGDRCYAASGQPCPGTAGECLPADDEPQISYCSPTCDPAVPGTCPTNAAAGPMECVPAGSRSLCRYPEPTPGVLGSRCDQGLQSYEFCAAGCLSPGGPDSYCTRTCTSKADCPGAFACGVHPQDPGRQVCIRSAEEASDDGCSASGGGAGLLLGLAAIFGLRRRRTC